MIVLVPDLIESLALWIFMNGIIVVIGRPEINLDRATLPWNIDRVPFTLHIGGIQCQVVHLV